MTLTVIYPQIPGAGSPERLDHVLRGGLNGIEYEMFKDMDELPDLRGRKILFVIPIGPYGINPDYSRLLYRLRSTPGMLSGCVSAILIDGECEYYTKSAATELAFAVNLAGSDVVGRPVVEGTGSLTNFRVQAKLLGVDLKTAYRAACVDLVMRLMSSKPVKKERPVLLTLHASNYRTSNTMQLWAGVRERLNSSFEIREIGLRNGTVSDCSGCPYTMCIHFGEAGRCFYGGMMQDEVWPAVLKCDALMMICPNYNDALSANLTAFINRLTGLFRQKRFYDKALFAIIVSGYSGGDIVARQLIGGLNMNKSFYLPANFAMMETANDPGEALTLPGIEERMDNFAGNVRDKLLLGKENPGDIPE
ncbi:MAG: flavodoxin family protein [Anaerolineaceae bacterium]|nr:flavodoxin family protein [Anaerolineaceae bacterium]